MEYCAGGAFFRMLQRQPDKRLKEPSAKFYAAEVILFSPPPLSLCFLIFFQGALSIGVSSYDGVYLS